MKLEQKECWEWCSSHHLEDGKCDCSLGDLKELWWSSFTSLWNWIGQVNALVEVNKYLITDLAKSEDLLDRARVKTGDKKWTIPRIG